MNIYITFEDLSEKGLNYVRDELIEYLKDEIEKITEEIKGEEEYIEKCKEEIDDEYNFLVSEDCDSEQLIKETKEKIDELEYNMDVAKETIRILKEEMENINDGIIKLKYTEDRRELIDLLYDLKVKYRFRVII